ncbi:hypothetical protein BH09ACT10_BH09ACT10_24530 [soil metagenome]
MDKRRSGDESSGQRIAEGTRVSAPRRRVKKRIFPTPAAAGVLALVLAGVGTLLIGPRIGSSDLTTDYQTISQNYSDSGFTGTDGNAIDISRDFDRELAEKQTAEQVRQRERALSEDQSKIQSNEKKLEKNQWVVPVAGYRLTARFGQRSSLWSTVHTGLDFAAPSGTGIVAIAGGTVVSAGYDGSYGNKTIIRLEDGTELWYCHQTSIIVKAGEVVAPGQPIGYVGSTGNTTGPHLHLEVHSSGGDPIDPYRELVAHGVTP